MTVNDMERLQRMVLNLYRAHATGHKLTAHTLFLAQKRLAVAVTTAKVLNAPQREKEALRGLENDVRTLKLMLA